jgi:endonuclease YncB( thermonuclease family)
MIGALLAVAVVGRGFTCQAIALHDVDGPIHCRSGEKIRLQGIGATETDGHCRPNQPCVPGDPIAQRRIMATRVIRAQIAREDASPYGQAWFAEPVQLDCVATGRSHTRVTAWCRREDGADLSCEAIRAGIAARWPRYDREERLARCAPQTLRASLARFFGIGKAAPR